jgi:protein N-terminal amidase
MDQTPYETVTEEVGANSAIFYGPDGEFVGNYRKTNPFETDMTWSKPGETCNASDLLTWLTLYELKGTGFAVHQLPHPIHTIALGICMDLNTQPPAIWSLEDGPYEIADFCLEKKANLLVLLNAWLDSREDTEVAKDWRTLNFWAARLRPLWARSEELEEEADSDSDADDDSHNKSIAELSVNGPETTVIVCNRSGQENGKMNVCISGGILN